MTGLIQIESTADGDRITVSGDYSNRLQHGAYALLKALNIFADRIAENDDVGYTASPPMREQLPTRRPMPSPLKRKTGFGDLR